VRWVPLGIKGCALGGKLGNFWMRFYIQITLVEADFMDKKMFYDATPNSFEKARWLRNNSTKHEKMVWDCLRKNKILGVRIKRQHPIGTYIADFYCHAAKLVIEIDGAIHNNADQKLYDEERTFNLKINGLKVVRFSNAQIEDDLNCVMEDITKHIQERLRSK
jgi:very-short-patch-repair endonuclease